MKRLVCEMCGSSDIVKQDGFFVCQNCGVKYTIDEAKKMMVEFDKPVEVIVKKDVNKLTLLASTALKHKNFKDAAKYYDQAYQENPKDLSLICYSEYCKFRDEYPLKSSKIFCSYFRDVLETSKEDITSNFELVAEVIDFAIGKENCFEANLLRVSKNKLNPSVFSNFFSLLTSLQFDLLNALKKYAPLKEEIDRCVGLLLQSLYDEYGKAERMASESLSFSGSFEDKCKKNKKDIKTIINARNAKKDARNVNIDTVKSMIESKKKELDALVSSLANETEFILYLKFKRECDVLTKNGKTNCDDFKNFKKQAEIHYKNYQDENDKQIRKTNKLLEEIRLLEAELSKLNQKQNEK